MDPIEQRIREDFARVTKEGSGVSPEYNLLSVSDTGFLLRQLDGADADAAIAADEIVELRKERDEQEDFIESLGHFCCATAFVNGQYEEHNEHVRTHAVCAFCGVDGERTPEAMLAHMKACEEHPYSEACAQVSFWRQAHEQVVFSLAPFKAGLDKVAEVAARTGDDLCWRYTEEILEAFGYGKRELRALPYEQFIFNCGRFHRSLETGEKYETAEERDKRVGDAAVAKYIADVAARRER